MTNIAAQALSAQINALIDGWQREAVEAQEQSRVMSGAEGRQLSSYYDGRADTLDRCVQALKLLNSC
jgi:uncharacterized protein YukE